MLRRTSRLLVLLAVLLMGGASAHAQEGITKKQQEKNLAHKMKDDTKEVKQELKRLHKQHLANQDKATRKRMKQHKRRADRQGNAGQREPFLRRLFHRKR